MLLKKKKKRLLKIKKRLVAPVRLNHLSNSRRHLPTSMTWFNNAWTKTSLLKKTPPVKLEQKRQMMSMLKRSVSSKSLIKKLTKTKRPPLRRQSPRKLKMRKNSNGKKKLKMTKKKLKMKMLRKTSQETKVLTPLR